MQVNKGCFVISLDFELLWGVFDLVNHKEKEEYFTNTKKVIPLILDSFAQYQIHATWAIVGMLFNSNWEEWNNNQPKVVPLYKNSSLSPYDFGNSISTLATEDFVFAPELIQQIKGTEGQEIGTHTYSHYYCLEQGQTIEQFAADLQKAIDVACEMNINLKSLVFPRNQLREEYLKICADMGIENVRSNPSSWYWQDTQSSSFLTKIGRSGDAYFPFGNKNYPLKELKKKKGIPLEQKAGRFLRPVEGNSFLRKLKLKRIMREMTMAAKKNEIYHLWWHPHNFGDHPTESLNDLKVILEHFDKLRSKFNFQSANMEEIGGLQKST
ncbi:polysaccharide deacetylase family protein [Zunongwangia sp. F260]|uniref:Polysaccharide deacetylase family protein n=1 Tax=Autumnicola lenta TaxID=3075593 RepID=A0ABU3CI48_9FLAO|nr:polysaccharide deacetylase family protein [Zunongwangia sp. F260]MDT0645898.1 polysaccharide deacetylase family protein [Zunongwangia sp. F260]